jgi:hypothetical protein
MPTGFPAASVWVSVTSQKAGSPLTGAWPGALKVPAVFRAAESTLTLARCSRGCR